MNSERALIDEMRPMDQMHSRTLYSVHYIVHCTLYNVHACIICEKEQMYDWAYKYALVYMQFKLNTDGDNEDDKGDDKTLSMMMSWSPLFMGDLVYIQILDRQWWW